MSFLAAARHPSPPDDREAAAEAAPGGEDPAQLLPGRPEARYTSGCSELDGRVLGTPLNGGGLRGGTVCISADGDVGIVLSLEVTVRHLRRDATATARLITTLPVAHVVRLLKGVIKGASKAAEDDAQEGARPGQGLLPSSSSSASSKAALLGRVFISRIYAPDDLQAVLDELEAGVPFQQLRSASDRQAGHDQPGGPRPAAVGPSIVVLTELDHHFKWMRLQGHDGRLHGLYEQLMRRLRALAAAGPGRPLVLVLNGTIARRPDDWSGAAAPADDGLPRADADAGAGASAGGEAHGNRTPAPPASEQDVAYRLALAALQQGRHIGRPDAFRLCCDELARAQCLEPRYKTLINYFCDLHVCLTRLPHDLVAMWGGREGGGGGGGGGGGHPADSALWVAHVESDESEISQRSTDRIGVVHFAHGYIQDASCA